MRLWLLRHAQPKVAPGVCYGRLDVPADAVQTVQVARAVVQALQKQGVAPVALRTSPRVRARALAQALAAPLGLPLEEDGRLAEMDFGCWEGVPWDRIPQAAFDAWTADFAHHRFGGRECTQQVLERVWQAMQQARASAGDQLWVTHAGVIRAAQHLQVRGRPQIETAAQWPREAPAFGGWVVVDL